MNEQIITWLPASHLMSTGVLPEEFEVCHAFAVANASGCSGVLVRNRDTGLYWLWSPTAIYPIAQKFAQRIHAEK